MSKALTIQDDVHKGRGKSKLCWRYGCSGLACEPPSSPVGVSVTSQIETVPLSSSDATCTVDDILLMRPCHVVVGTSDHRDGTVGSMHIFISLSRKRKKRRQEAKR